MKKNIYILEILLIYILQNHYLCALFYLTQFCSKPIASGGNNCLMKVILSYLQTVAFFLKFLDI